MRMGENKVSLSQEQLKAVADMRAQGFGEGYIAWAVGCTEKDLPSKTTKGNGKPEPAKPLKIGGKNK